MVNIKKIVVLFAVSAVLVAPVFVLADPDNQFGNPPAIQTESVSIAFLTNMIGDILDLIWIIFIAIAIIMFLIAGFQFLAAHGEPEGLGKAQKSLLRGIVGVSVGVAAFTLPFFIRNKVSPVTDSNMGQHQNFINV